MLRIGAGLCLLAIAMAVNAAAIRVPADASLGVAAGQVRAACADLSVNGVADAGSGALLALRHVEIAVDGMVAGGSGRIEVGGDWRNQGVFQPEDGTVAFVDGCATSSTLSGELRFNRLEFVSNSGRSIVLPAGRVTSVTQHLRIDGSGGAPIDVRSSSASQPAFLCLLPGATSSLQNVDLAAGNVRLLSGNCGNGVVQPAPPVLVPVSSWMSLFALGVLLLVPGLLLARHRRV